jgi:TRAP-type C4-dicarboxylate transport system permease small subunit
VTLTLEKNGAPQGNPFSRTMDILVWAITTICCVLLVWLIAITGIQVFGRYVLNDSPTWVERAALLTILYITLPMAAVGIRQRFHMSVTFGVEALSRRGQDICAAAVDLGLAFFGAAMAWHGGVIAHRVWTSKMAVLPLPEGVTYLPLVICGGLIVIFSIERLAGMPHRLRQAAILPHE